MSLKFKIDQRSVEKFKQSLTKLANPVDSRTASTVGKVVVRGMKNSISKGISPIRGPGIKARLPGYRDSYVRVIRRGRGDFRGKRTRPVNLKLTGDFLKALMSRVIRVKGENVSQIKFRTREAELKELGHRKGTNNQRKRPIIPIRKEQMNATITLSIVKIYEALIQSIIKKNF